MKGRRKCPENDCGYQNNEVTDRFVNGSLHKWIGQFDGKALIKGEKTDEKLLEFLSIQKYDVEMVKEKGNYENLNVGKIFGKIAPLFSKKQYSHYLF